MYRITYKSAAELNYSDIIETLSKQLLTVVSITNHRLRYRYITQAGYSIEDSLITLETSMYSVLDYTVLKEKQLWLWEQEEMEAELKRHEESI